MARTNVVDEHLHAARAQLMARSFVPMDVGQTEWRRSVNGRFDLIGLRTLKRSHGQRSLVLEYASVDEPHWQQIRQFLISIEESAPPVPSSLSQLFLPEKFFTCRVLDANKDELLIDWKKPNARTEEVVAEIVAQLADFLAMGHVVNQQALQGPEFAVELRMPQGRPLSSDGGAT